MALRTIRLMGDEVLNKPCKPVKEIRYGSGQHEHECYVNPSLESKNNPDDPTEEIHRGYTIGNILLHGLLDAELGLEVLGKSVLVNHEVDALALDKLLGGIPDTLVFAGYAP